MDRTCAFHSHSMEWLFAELQTGWHGVTRCYNILHACMCVHQLFLWSPALLACVPAMLARCCHAVIVVEAGRRQDVVILGTGAFALEAMEAAHRGQARNITLISRPRDRHSPLLRDVHGCHH